MSNYLSIYASHDASICFRTGQNDFVILELERLTKIRNYTLNTDPNFREIITNLKIFIENKHQLFEWEGCYYAELNPEQVQLLMDVFGFKFCELISHHLGHAAGSLYQSDFDEALIVSSDSGGFETETESVATFCIFHAKKYGEIKKIASIPLDACGGYTLLSVPISEIKKQDVWTDYLRYAGKLMALAGYGKIRPGWFDAIKEYFYLPVRIESLKQLGHKIGLDLSDINTISGQDAYDLAATGQYIFEQITINAILPFVKTYQLPVIHTGGSALNVLLNERLRKEIGFPVFIPCNPNDCGLAFGFMALRNPPDKPINIQYGGFPILDIEDKVCSVSRKVDFKEVARMIARGKIIAIVRGNSEVGPRALGNRSIVCLPFIKGIKEKLNSLKGREWFRPVSPVIKIEDAEKYFEFSGESKFMSYAPKVKEEYKELLIEGAMHVDGTARLQTVSKEDNEFFYMLIDAIETITGMGMLINTSFNIKGKPILTTVEDALEVLDTTYIDAVLIEDNLYEK